MKHARLELAHSAGLLPSLEGLISVFGPIEQERLRGLEKASLRCVSSSFAVTEMLKLAGISAARTLDVPVKHAVVFVPRAKADAWDVLSKAIQAATDGWIIVDGQKNDGIESIAKQIARSVIDVKSYSKGHGKTIWFQSCDAQALIKPVAVPEQNSGGFLTAPGVFSADDIDPASELLFQNVPSDLSGKIADFGAGWGFLSARLLSQSTSLETVHLVEDNAVALDCAQANVEDPRAQYHWADALAWTPPKPLDAVIMNPPFHTTRSAEPELGIKFIRAAARVLRPGGRLYIVANAHLPYESTLEQCFDTHEVLTRTNRYKVFAATRGRGKWV